MGEIYTFDDAVAFVDGLINRGVKLGLDNTRRLMAALDDPQTGQQFVHVAGTNGKGSVCAFVASALRQAGWRVGLFTSPHLVSVRERIRVNGKPLTEAQFVTLVNEICRRADDMFGPESKQPATYFEFTTAMALLHFLQDETDAAVIEVGLGGRLDSTNVITPAVSVITHIDLDHMAALGNDLATIAGEKAGIIKPGVPIVCGERKREATARIAAIAAEREARLILVGREFEVLGYELRGQGEQWQQANRVRWQDEERTIVTDLVGRHQAINVAVSYAVLRTLQEEGQVFDLEAAVKGLETARWPARLQWLEPGLLIDSAHNPSGIAETVASLQQLAPGRTFNVLLAVLNDKAWRESLPILRPIARSLRLIRINQPRSEDPYLVKRHVRQTYPELPVKVCRSVDTAIRQLRREGDGLILGSIYFAGEVFDYLWPGEAVEL